MSDDALFDWGAEGEPKSERETEQERRDKREAEKEAWEQKRKAAEQKLADDVATAHAEIDAIRNEPQGDYTWLWVGQLPKTWKTKAKELTGQKIGDDQYLRVLPNRLFGSGTHVMYKSGFVQLSTFKDITVLRLTKTQATMAKLRKTGTEYVVEDDDGSLWKHYALLTRQALADILSSKHRFGEKRVHTQMVCELARNLKL